MELQVCVAACTIPGTKAKIQLDKRKNTIDRANKLLYDESDRMKSALVGATHSGASTSPSDFSNHLREFVSSCHLELLHMPGDIQQQLIRPDASSPHPLHFLRLSHLCCQKLDLAGRRSTSEHSSSPEGLLQEAPEADRDPRKNPRRALRGSGSS